MFEYRVTKYDPALRDGDAYTQGEWTAYSDIGRPFGGVVLTSDQYQRVEDAYVAAALDFLREAGVSALLAIGLENGGGSPASLIEGSMLSLEQLGDAIPRLLREEFWCRLEGSGAFVHVGYDYYKYVGVPQACPQAEQKAGRLGLFVEPCSSPYSQ